MFANFLEIFNADSSYFMGTVCKDPSTVLQKKNRGNAFSLYHTIKTICSFTASLKLCYMVDVISSICGCLSTLLFNGVPENRTSPHINRTSPVYGHNCTSQHLYKPTNSRTVCVLNSSVQCRPIVPACHTTHHA